MKTILITGANGQLGNELRLIEKNYPDYRFLFTDVDELDITDVEAIRQTVRTSRVDFILNCAAYTAVDKAESDDQTAYRINAIAPQLLGVVASETGAKVIHISTDYVFDGHGYTPYTEDQSTHPQGAYGKTKQMGEKLLSESCSDSMIIRTSWLYSRFGNNFVKTMIKLGRERDALNIVFDQIGTPTYAADLAAVMMQAILLSENAPFPTGIYHFSNEGVCSWYDFARSIHRYAGIVNCTIRPIESKDYPTPAPRPHYSVLNKGKIKSTLGITIAHWEDSLQLCLQALGELNG